MIAPMQLAGLPIRDVDVLELAQACSEAQDRLGSAFCVA
jgi:hypothetical protein